METSDSATEKKKRVEECANTALVLPFCFYRPGHLKVQAEGGGGVNLMAPPLLGTLILYVREGNAVVSDPSKCSFERLCYSSPGLP